MPTTTGIANRTLATATSVILIIAALAAGCDGPTAPRVGTIHVSVQQSGGDLDVDGFDIVVDSTVRKHLAANAAEDVTDLSAGSHTVALANVAENCTVSGTYPRPILVIGGQTTDVTVEMQCVATGIAVTANTTGFINPTARYQVVVSGQQPIGLDANGSAGISRLRPGLYTVSLIVPTDHCTVEGGNQTTVRTIPGVLFPVSFSVACVAPARKERIAFDFDSSVNDVHHTWIAVVDPDGSDRQLLREGNSASWSPDGANLVFNYWHCIGCTSGLAVLNPETLDTTIPQGGEGGAEPAWSPTGNEVVFRCCELGALSILRLGSPPGVRVATGVHQVDRPRWSPDGQRLAFTCEVEAPKESEVDNFDLCLANKDGTGLVRLTNGAAFEMDPAWSPDGKRIAFTRNALGPEMSIAVLNLDDGRVTPLTGGSQPAWSPDGTKLVFKGNDGLYTINADGSNRKRIAMGVVGVPAWRP